MSKTNVPLEEEEQIAFVQWCHVNNIIVHHSGNEIGGSTIAMKNRARKMKRLGTSAGFPDLVLFIPIPFRDGYDLYQIAFVEMKRIKGSVTSPAQLKWMNIIKLANIPCAICKGADEAMQFVKNVKENSIEQYGGVL